MTDIMTPPLRVGDRLRDNDPHGRGRVRMVIGIRRGVATLARSATNRTGLSYDQTDCIHLDGKPRRSGWSRVNRPTICPLSPPGGAPVCQWPDCGCGEGGKR